VIRRAKALAHVLDHQAIGINERELIVGMQTGSLAGVPVFPEMAVDWLEDELLEGGTGESVQGREFVIGPGEAKALREMLPFWRGKTLKERVFARLPDEAVRARRGLLFNLAMHEDSGLGHVLMDYPGFFVKGFAGIIRESRERMSGLEVSDPAQFEKYLFWKAVLIVGEAVIAFSRRHAAEARRVASLTEDPERKRELSAIRDVCEWVPENPPRTLHEALQACWFVQLIAQIETNGSSVSLGRFDQYMLPFLRDDIACGRLSKTGAQELIECFFLKLSEIKKIRARERRALHGGYTRFQNLTLGGQTPRGGDATNELTYMVLDVRDHLDIVDPQLSLRVHQGSPDGLLGRAAELIAKGGGHPALFSDAVIIPSLLSRGVPLPLARDYAIIGCVETGFLGLWGRCDGGYTNIPKALQLALHDGIDILTGERLGLATGGPQQLRSFEDVREAFRKQLANVVSLQTLENNIIDQVHAEVIPHVFVSCFVPGCLETGCDVTQGGARYNWTAPLGVGIANVANSLAALKKAVYEDGRYSIEDVLRALQRDFEGEEELLRALREAPKFGNDIDCVDELCREAADLYFSCVETHRTPRGGRHVPCLYSLTSNIPLGWATGATPDGRRARQPFAEGISPAAGTDTEGPTASLKSAARIDLVRATGGVILNQKFGPNLLRRPEDRDKFIGLIKTYLLTLGGMEVQYNVVSRELLMQAKEQPELFRNLIVRVTGYSAYFVDLSEEVQDDIIGRTEYG
jgi:formate C-acetyltransferase